MLDTSKFNLNKLILFTLLVISFAFIIIKYWGNINYVAAADGASISSLWQIEDIEKLEINENNELPVFKKPEDLIAPDFYTWDFWPLYLKNGQVASIEDNHFFLFSLSAPRSIFPEERHDIACIRFYQSGSSQKEWLERGYLFPKGQALGSRQWTGTSIWNHQDNLIDFYYTKAGDKNSKEVSFLQSIAKTSAKTKLKDGKLELSDWTEHKVILYPTEDNKYYDLFENFDEYGIVTSFRDPFYFIDPQTNDEYLIFTARDKILGNKTFNGSIGIAKKVNVAGEEQWEYEKPLLISDKVSAELEVAQIFYWNKKYYLFFTSQATAFNRELKAPTGFYGFVANSLHGQYKPLNKSGLVISTPEDNPFQNHAFRVVDFENNRVTVINWLNYFSKVNPYKQSKEWQKENIAATLDSHEYVFEIKDSKTKLLAN